MLRAFQICGLLSLFLSIAFSAEAKSWPLWDGAESIENYSARVKVPATYCIDLGSAGSVRLKLIPAMTFMMGVKEPVSPPPPIIPPTPILVLGLSGAAILLVHSVVTAIRRRQRLQISLRRLILISIAVAISIGGAVQHYRMKEAALAYERDLERYCSAKDNEKPAKSVTIAKPFYIGEFAVTQEQYQAIMAVNPSKFKGPNRPVETVSWKKAVEFCRKVGDQSHRCVRLPTEAEWELAARAGTTAQIGAGNTEADLDRVAWYNANSKGVTHVVGAKEPNAFGLYDMLGNVFQWCADRGIASYAEVPSVDSPNKQSERRPYEDFYVMRGGSWYSGATECRVTNRAGAVPEMELEYIGFRVVVDVDGQ